MCYECIPLASYIIAVLVNHGLSPSGAIGELLLNHDSSGIASEFILNHGLSSILSVAVISSSCKAAPSRKQKRCNAALDTMDSPTD